MKTHLLAAFLLAAAATQVPIAAASQSADHAICGLVGMPYPCFLIDCNDIEYEAVCNPIQTVSDALPDASACWFGATAGAYLASEFNALMLQIPAIPVPTGSFTDADSDGVPEVAYTGQTASISCTPSASGLAGYSLTLIPSSGGSLPFPDPDPTNPCIPLPQPPTCDNPATTVQCSDPSTPYPQANSLIQTAVLGAAFGPPTLVDSDGDGVPVVHQTRYTTSVPWFPSNNAPNCWGPPTLTPGPGTTLPYPDPDDADPCVPIPSCGGLPPPPGCPPACPPPPPACTPTTINVPQAPTLADRDGDGFNVIELHSRPYTLTSSCSLGPSGPTTTTPVAAPDPDDADACNPNPTSCGGGPGPLPPPCGLLPGTGITAPSGYAARDTDGDGWPQVGVTTTTYTITPTCGLTPTPSSTVWCSCPDPDDTDPSIPGAPSPGDVICGTQPQPCIILVQTVSGACSEADHDGDHVPVVYTCDTTITCWSDGTCSTTNGPVTGSYGDGDDNDACNPVSHPAASPNCHSEPNQDPRSTHNTTYGQDGASGIFQQTFSKWDWPWWILLVAVALILYAHHRGKKNGRRKAQREGRRTYG